MTVQQGDLAMAKKSGGTGNHSLGAGLSGEVEVVTSVDQGKPANRLAVITEILVFVDGRLTKVKRGHVRTVDVQLVEEKAKR
jgi:hypothetical protein